MERLQTLNLTYVNILKFSRLSFCISRNLKKASAKVLGFSFR